MKKLIVSVFTLLLTSTALFAQKSNEQGNKEYVEKYPQAGYSENQKHKEMPPQGSEVISGDRGKYSNPNTGSEYKGKDHEGVNDHPIPNNKNGNIEHKGKDHEGVNDHPIPNNKNGNTEYRGKNKEKLENYPKQDNKKDSSKNNKRKNNK